MSDEELTLFWDAKICIPEEEKHMVSRSHLLDRLETCTEQIIVFWANAGFGKTALMAEFARKHHRHCVWYRINEFDNHPAHFLRGFHLAVSKTVRIQANPLYLCIDDFQIIKNEHVYRFIESILVHGKGKVRLFLTVKGDFPKFLASYFMRENVRIICAKHLRFNKLETEQLLQQMTTNKLPEHFVDNVVQYTGGWPAGIVFAGIGIKNKLPDGGILRFDKTHLYDYIFYEIFRKLSDDIQSFLTETSVFDEMDARLCNYVLKRSDSEQIFAYLIRENLFLSKQNGTPNKYSYDSVFAGFLQSIIKAERKEQIIYRALEYYAECGEWEKSAKLSEKYRKKAVLQIHCLGEFSADGPLGKMSFRTKKTRELFACLFFEEGRGLKRDTLIERLWPETDNERASVLFYTTVSYLRKAFTKSGIQDLLIVENQTYALKFSKIHSDLAVLMNWRKCADTGRIPKNANVLEAAAIYQNGYMYGEDYVWLLEYREYVEQIFIQTMGKLATIQIHAGEYGQAVLLLKRAFQVNSYDSFISELLVECLLLTGDIKGAKQQYAKMAEICRKELCEEPGKNFQDFVISAKSQRRKNNNSRAVTDQ